MKKQIILSLLLFYTSIFTACAQEDKSKRPSPPVEANGSIGDIKIQIDYSAPSARGRKMIGGVEAYGQVWRTGANESTTIEVDQDVKIEGKRLAKGKYALFTIPNQNEWIIIINTGIGWGAYKYKEAEDVLRVTVPTKELDTFVEQFNISVAGDMVTLKWENTEVSFKVSK